MYEKYYNLTVDPFRLVPDYRFSYGHASYSNAKAYLEYALFRGEGFITVTGAAGTGKTTLINQMLAELDNSKVKVATIAGSQLEADDLLEMVAAAFNLRIKGKGKSKLLLSLEDFFASQRARGQRSLIVVDEAQDIPDSAIEELRLLSNLQRESQLLLQVFLVGQEKLKELILRPEMDHLRQRIVASANLETLTFEETVSYVEHRLRKVGWKGDPQISGAALNLIHKSSGGTPRRINLICSRLFLYCSLDKKHKFTIDDARSVIDDLVTEALIDKKTIDKANGKHSDNTLNAKYSLPREMVKSDTGKASTNRRQTKERPSARQQAAVPGKNSTRKATEKAKRPANTAHTKPVIPPTRSSIRPTRAGQPAPPARSGHRSAPPPVQHRGKAKQKPAWVQPSLYILAGAVVALVLSGLFRRDDVEETTPIANTITPSTVQDLAQIEPEEDLEMERSDPVTLEEMIAPSTSDEMDELTVSPAEETQTAQRTMPSLEEQGGASRSSDLVVESNDDNYQDPSLANESSTEISTPAPSEADHVVVENQKTIAPVSPDVVVLNEEPAVTEEASSELDRKIALEQQQQRIRADAQARLATNLAKYSANDDVRDASIIVSREPVVRASEPVIVIPVKQKASKPKKRKPPANKTDRRDSAPVRLPLKSIILGNQWSSRDKPATLLPSIATLCKGRDSVIDCSSKPKNVTTKYGLAVYKVEARLSDFLDSGRFRLGYRTLVMLVDEPLSINNGSPESDDERWQVTEKVMSCWLSRLEGNVRCEDEKGVTRSYQISSAASLKIP